LFSSPNLHERRGTIFGIIPAEGRPTVVRVVYSDESGVGNRKNEPVTVVTGIVINIDKEWRRVEKKLLAIYESTPNDLLEKKKGGYVLKGRILYSAFKNKVPGAEKTLRKTLEIPSKCGISIFYGAIDRETFEENYPARKLSPRERELISAPTDYDLAFQQCLRKLDKIARSFAGEKVLWIAERSDPQREPSTRMIHRIHGITVENMIDFTRPDWQLVRDDPMTVVDTIYFGDPTESIALQLADVCCSTVTRFLLEKHYGWKALATPLYDELIRDSVTDATAPIVFSARA
jgi:hypothetical protein